MHSRWAKVSGLMLVVGTSWAGTADAARITNGYSVPVVYTGPSSTQTYDFTVPGFNPALGTLSSVSVALNNDYGTSTLDWVLTNTGTTTVSGSGAYTEGQTYKILRSDTGASISSGSGSISATNGFSLAPGQTTTVHAFGTGGGGSGSVSSANRAYFSNTGDVNLRVQTTGETLALSSGLSLVSQSGDVQTTVSGSITYTYASSNTTPPASAVPIVISSSTALPLSAGEVKWYKFDYAGGALTIDTLNSMLSPGNDTQIGLYNSVGAVVKLNDDISGSNYLSKISYASGALANGTYYLAVTGYNGTQSSYFGKGFDVSTSSDDNYTGTVVVNLTGTPTPEPATLGLAGVAVVGLLRRKRAGTQSSVRA